MKKVILITAVLFMGVLTSLNVQTLGNNVNDSQLKVSPLSVDPGWYSCWFQFNAGNTPELICTSQYDCMTECVFVTSFKDECQHRTILTCN